MVNFLEPLVVVGGHPAKCAGFVGGGTTDVQYRIRYTVSRTGGVKDTREVFVDKDGCIPLTTCKCVRDATVAEKEELAKDKEVSREDLQLLLEKIGLARGVSGGWDLAAKTYAALQEYCSVRLVPFESLQDAGDAVCVRAYRPKPPKKREAVFTLTADVICHSIMSALYENRVVDSADMICHSIMSALYENRVTDSVSSDQGLKDKEE